MNLLLVVNVRLELSGGVTLVFFDLLVAFLLHVDDLLLGLGHLGVFLLLVVHVTDFGLTNKVITVECAVTCSNLAINVVIEDKDFLFVQVELGFLDLALCGQRRIKFELLGHL